MKMIRSIPAIILSFGASFVLAADLPSSKISYNELMVKPSENNQKTALRGASNRVLQNSWQMKAYTNMDNQMMWESKDISDYSFRLDYQDNMAPSMIVTVVNKNQATGVDANGQTVASAPTHDDHFRRIQNALQQGAAFAEFTYDPVYGFPDSIDIIYLDMSVYKVKITDFRPNTNNKNSISTTTTLSAQYQPVSKSASTSTNSKSVGYNSWQTKALTNMDNQGLWESKGISNYSFRLDYEDHIEPSMIVTVVNKNQATGIDANGNTVASAPTHDDHFRRIQNALQQGAAFAKFTYDPVYGFPDSIDIVYLDMSVYKVKITDFAPKN